MDVIGRYRLQSKIGAGAFATVWRGYDDDLDVDVAVKVLADNWASRADVRERFLAEARLMRRIASDRVVRVFDLGELPDGRPYFVMDFVSGGSLAEVLSHGPLDPADALWWGADLARAVAALHEEGSRCVAGTYEVNALPDHEDAFMQRYLSPEESKKDRKSVV